MSLAAYALARVLEIDGCESGFAWASRVLAAASVLATIELRVLLIEAADAAVAQQTIPGAKEFLERRTGFLKGKIEELQPVVMVRLPPPPAGSALRRRDGGPQAKMREKQMVDEVLQVHRRSMRRPCPPPPTR